ncbi:MAG: Tn3 family transposase [Pseudonocardiaceae bacterium]
MPDPQALSITYAPIAVPGVPALARHRLGYVEHTFLRAENYAAADPDLVTTQAGIGFAQALGDGLVAAIDEVRCVVRCRPPMPDRTTTTSDPNAASLGRPTTRTPPAS